MQAHRVWTLAIITLTFAVGLSVYDPPGVENVVPQLNTDSAVAGRQYKYRCQLPYGIERSIAGDWGYSSWQPSKTLAIRSAYTDASDGKYRVTEPAYVDGTVRLLDRKGREVYTIAPRCNLLRSRWKSGR